MNRHIAVSGPAKSFSKEVVAAIDLDLLDWIDADDFIYTGGAFGIDTLAAVVARAKSARFVLVAPEGCWYNVGLRAIANEIIDVPGGYMARNDRLADVAVELVAYPPKKKEELRSGTWATVRRFKKHGKSITIKAWEDL